MMKLEGKEKGIRLLRWLNLWKRIGEKRECHRKDALEICTNNHEFKAMNIKDQTP